MRICIVGGGSSGWMTATTVTQLLECDGVTLIESPNFPISGVGESTIQQIRGWLDLIGVNETEMIRETNGSFKHSIKFTNFLKKDSGSFHYPFGQVIHNPKEWWENSSLLSSNKYAEDINPVALVAESGKFDSSTAYSFHFDAVKFGQYLRKTYCNDVKHITAEIVGCEKGENGIEYLKLDNGDMVEADLFIDCSGFKSLLLGEYMEEPFISYDHLIPNDTAWATQVSYIDKEKQLVAYTECTAIDNGWVWNIPLWERIGTGYVYSSKHVSDEDAKQEFLRHLQSKGFDTSECVFKRIPMRIGRHERTFVKNVVAIGLSAGFIEPLESNGLFTVHQNLIDLYKTLRRGKPSQYMKDMYNSATSLSFDEFVDFVAVHYALTQREDTPYWRDNFNRSYDLVGSGNFDKYGLTAFSRELYKFSSYNNLNRGFHYIASGMNVSSYIKIKCDTNTVEVNALQWRSVVETLPSLYDFLMNIHLGD
jgi:tryptophan halogenase